MRRQGDFHQTIVGRGEALGSHSQNDRRRKRYEALGLL